MIAVDTNLLVYAHREEYPQHKRAKEVLSGLRQSPAPWAIPWPCVHEFYAVTTHPRIHKTPTPSSVALATVRSWQATGNLVLLGEGQGYLDCLTALCASTVVAGPAIHDARIAALCAHHGVRELWTADRDFSAFPALRCRNPLVV